MSTTFSFIYWHTDPNYNNSISGHEIQCWVNNVNVALSSNGAAVYYVDQSGDISTITNDSYNNKGNQTSDRNASLFTDNDATTNYFASSYKKNLILFLNKKYKLSDLQRVIFYNHMKFGGSYSNRYNYTISVFLLDSLFNIVGEFDHNYLTNFSQISYINMIGPADTPNDPNIQYPVYTTSQKSFSLTSPSVNTITLTNYESYAFNEPDENYFDFKYQPFDYRIEGNENYYLIGAHKVYDLKTISDGTFSQNAFIHNSNGTNVHKFTFTLREPSSNTSFSASSTNSGYFKINNNLNSIVLTDTNSPSTHPYYFKYGSSGVSNSLFYKDINGKPIINNNFNILNEIGATTADNSHFFALSFDSSLDENSLIMPINYTSSMFGSLTFRFVSIFSDNITYLSKKNIRHFNWNNEMKKKINQVGNLNDGDDIYLYILEFGNRFHYLSSNTITNKYLLSFNHNKVIDINDVDDNLELIRYKEFISEKSDDYIITGYPDHIYPILMNNIKHYPVTDVFNFNINNNELIADTSYILLEMGGTVVCKHIYMINNTIFLQIIDIYGYNELFELGTYNSNIETNIIVTEINYLTDASFNIKIYLNNLNIINKNVSINNNNSLRFFGTNEGGIGNFGDDVHSSISSFSSSIQNLNYANYYIFKNSYEEILSHNHTKYMKHKHNINNSKYLFDINKDNIYFKIASTTVTNSGISYDKEINKSINLTDLQMEYIANSLQNNKEWTSNYDIGENGYKMIVNDSEWEFSSDVNGYYYKKLNDSQSQSANNYSDVLFPNYKNISYILNTDNPSISPDGFSYEIWIKLDDTISATKKYNVFGLETGSGPYLALNDSTIGGMGITPGATDNNVYSLTKNPYYINESPNFGNLLHLVGYMYPNTTTNYERGVYKNSVLFLQENTIDSGYSGLPSLDSIQNSLDGLKIGLDCKNIKIYSFRLWHRRLLHDEVNFLYNQGPSYSTTSVLYTNELIYEFIGTNLSSTSWLPSYIKGIDNSNYTNNQIILNSLYHESKKDINLDMNYLSFKNNHLNSVLSLNNDSMDDIINNFDTDLSQNGIMFEAWVLVENEYDTINRQDINIISCGNKKLLLNNFLDSSGNIGMFENNIINNNNKFKYIWIQTRSGLDTSDPLQLHLAVQEIECYINGVNVALSSNGGSATFTSNNMNDTNDNPFFSSNTNSRPYPSSNAIDGVLNNLAHSTSSHHNILVTLSQEYSIKELQRIIVYNRTTNPWNKRYGNMVGKISLLNSSNEIMGSFTHSTTFNSENIRYLNYIGPSNTSLDSSKIFTSNNLDVSIVESNLVKKFKYIHFIVEPDTIHDEFWHIFEVQLWINNVNVALSSNGSTATFTSLTDITDTNDSPYTSLGADKAINNVIPTTSSNTDIAHSNGTYQNLLITLPEEYEIDDIQRMIVYNRINYLDHYEQTYRVRLLDSNKNTLSEINHYGDTFNGIKYINYIGKSDNNSNINYTIHNSNNKDYTFTTYQSYEPGTLENTKENYIHVVGYMFLNGNLNIERGIYLNGIKYQQNEI